MSETTQGQGATPTFHQGSWACTECGSEITQLPFQPEEGRPLRCRDCHRNWREQQSKRTMVQGSWTCASCGASIQELPFHPTQEKGVLCRACHRQARAT